MVTPFHNESVYDFDLDSIDSTLYDSPDFEFMKEVIDEGFDQHAPHTCPVLAAFDHKLPFINLSSERNISAFKQHLLVDHDYDNGRRAKCENKPKRAVRGCFRILLSPCKSIELNCQSPLEMRIPAVITNVSATCNGQIRLDFIITSWDIEKFIGLFVTTSSGLQPQTVFTAITRRKNLRFSPSTVSQLIASDCNTLSMIVYICAVPCIDDTPALDLHVLYVSKRSPTVGRRV